MCTLEVYRGVLLGSINWCALGRYTGVGSWEVFRGVLLGGIQGFAPGRYTGVCPLEVYRGSLLGGIHECGLGTHIGSQPRIKCLHHACFNCFPKWLTFCR